MIQQVGETRGWLLESNTKSDGPFEVDKTRCACMRKGEVIVTRGGETAGGNLQSQVDGPPRDRLSGLEIRAKFRLHRSLFRIL